MESEGYIKFQIDHTYEQISIPNQLFETVSFWRTKFFDLQLIGTLPNGIGFGNISHKNNHNFYITGSATGSDRELPKSGYALVTEFNIEKNAVKSIGETKASSESLSHAAIYLTKDDVNAVIHIHNKTLWEKLIHKLPTTPLEIAYGTPAMAEAVIKVVNTNSKNGIIVMGGHEDGILSYGSSISDAANQILKYI